MGRIVEAKIDLRPPRTPTTSAGWPRAISSPRPGARTDYRYLMDDLLAFADRFRVQELAYDPREAELLMQQVREQVAFPCIEITQAPVSISEPMKEFEALYLSGQLRHDGDPLLA